ncbi:MAG TPA: YggT family protein, partial [Gammaproteobacteria bacterium]|nr:YggT family protein [Gammaproteobacteria bacterium]
LSEPFLSPFRRIVPDLGGLDLSPILLFVVINILEAIVIRGPARSLGMSSTVAQFFTGIS